MRPDSTIQSMPPRVSRSAGLSQGHDHRALRLKPAPRTVPARGLRKRPVDVGVVDELHCSATCSACHRAIGEPSLVAVCIRLLAWLWRWRWLLAELCRSVGHLPYEGSL